MYYQLTYFNTFYKRDVTINVSNISVEDGSLWYSAIGHRYGVSIDCVKSLKPLEN